MPSNLRYSAAKTSTIRKSPFKSSSKSPIKNLLPGQAKYKQVNHTMNEMTKTAQKKERLQVEDYNVELDFQLSRKESVLTAIDTIVQNQWSESSDINNKYSSKEDIKTMTMEQLVFQLKGLSMSVKAEIMKYRQNLPSCLITANQLYSIFEKEGNTFVDRNVELSLRKGDIKKFVITNAAPIIQNTNSGMTGKITYGFENVEVLVKAHEYTAIIESLTQRYKEDTRITKIIDKFSQHIDENPTALFVSEQDGFKDTELSTLVGIGLITLTSNHRNEIESQQFAISFPNCGTYLKLVNNGRSWLVKTLNKGSYHELLESDLLNRWEGIDQSGISKMTNFRKPFYGFDLNWILADAVGAGIVEVFNTPVGRGWKLTGKR